MWEKESKFVVHKTAVCGSKNAQSISFWAYFEADC